MAQTAFSDKLPAAKKQTSLVRKLSSVNRITVFFTAIVSGVALAVFFYSILTAQHEQATRASVSGYRILLDDFGLRAEGAAVSIAGRPDVVQAALNRNHQYAYKILSELTKQMRVDFIVLTDTSGNIISRGHSERYGDNIINQRAVKEAVRGRTTYSYEKGVLVRFAIRAGCPVYDSERRIIGAVVSGFNVSSADFLQKARATFGCDVMLYDGTEAVSSTIADEAGDMLAPPIGDDCIEAVFSRGEMYAEMDRIGKDQYYVVYWPVFDTAGKPAGMWALASNFSSSRAELIRTIGLRMLEIIAAVIILLVILVSIIANRIFGLFMRPLQRVSQAFTALSQGNANLSVQLDVPSNDEIGTLVSGFNKFIRKLYAIVKDVKESKATLVTAGEDMTGRADDTSSSITEIIANIENIHAQMDEQESSVEQTVGSVNEIASNIDSLERMIQNQSSSMTEASAAIEEMIVSIASVNQSVDKMVDSFSLLREKAQDGFIKQTDVNTRIGQIETQSNMLQGANTIIADIATRTNLLAMNASIEAAHAGKAGKGFAVVADEIRKLSKSSAAQSKRIGEELSNVQQAISSVVGASAELSSVFKSVSDELNVTNQFVLYIKQAMQEQNEGSKQIDASLRIVNGNTTSVQNASREMATGNKSILAEISKLQNNAAGMKAGMDEMAMGARQINETGAALESISTQVKEAIQKIESQIDQFEL